MVEQSRRDKANRRQKLGLVWRNRKKICQIIKAYFYLPFFLLIILWTNLQQQQSSYVLLIFICILTQSASKILYCMYLLTVYLYIYIKSICVLTKTLYSYQSMIRTLTTFLSRRNTMFKASIVFCSFLSKVRLHKYTI